jgi:hypothetical protein
MEESHEYSTSLRHKLDGPLAPYIDLFLRVSGAQGYANTSIHQRAPDSFLTSADGCWAS